MSDETYSDKQSQERFEAALRSAVKTEPKHFKEIIRGRNEAGKSKKPVKTS